MIRNVLVRNARDDEALRAYWATYEPIADEVAAELREACLSLPDFAEIVRAMPPEEAARQEARGRELQRAAIFDGRVDEYLADLTQQGVGYARMGIQFASWFELCGIYRDLVTVRLGEAAIVDLARTTITSQGLNRLLHGMNRILDVAMQAIAAAYLAAKEEIIRDQQEAIREISTPVLQIREQVLILPIVGMVDTHRARQITESVLKAIRARRARAVVMDVTGVPIVDSKVARHLAQTCEAARLMGASVIVTGISQEIAQTLVTIGADFSTVQTLGDLQSGIEEVERLLRGGVATVASS
jgi:anti-anti-sigma factor